MSFKALDWAISQDLRNPLKAVLILLAYRDNHDEPHGCFPSVARVAADCGLNRATVVRCLKTLVESGLVNRQSRRDPHGDKTTSYYTFPHVWVGADSTYLGAHSAGGGRTQHLPVGAHSTIEPAVVTGTEPKPRPQKSRPVHPPCGNLTKPQKKYAAVAKLLEGARQILLRDAREGGRVGLADLREELKCYAAARNLAYDGETVSTALDVAQRQILGGSSAGAQESSTPATIPSEKNAKAAA